MEGVSYWDAAISRQGRAILKNNSFIEVSAILFLFFMISSSLTTQAQRVKDNPGELDSLSFASPLTRVVETNRELLQLESVRPEKEAAAIRFHKGA